MLTNDHRAPLILVVEDDECHTELIRRAFQDAEDEYRLAVSTTLAEARLAMDHDAPALIFSDIHLPDGEGGGLILQAQDICPVIMMSALGTERLAADVIKAGAVDYLVKSALSFSALPRIARRAMQAWDVRRERLRADETARRARYEWEQTFNAIPDFIALIDSHNTIIRVNRALADRCGLHAAELVGKRCFDLIHGLPSPPYNCPHARMLREGGEQSEVVFEPRFNGVFDVTVSPLFDSGGKLFACVHMMRDITERKQREEALLISTAKFRAVLDNAADAVFIVDPAGRCVYANQEACRLTGYRQGELLSRDLAGFVMAGQRDDIQEKFRCLEPGKSVPVEATLKRSDGDQVAVDLNLVLLPDGNIYASCRDVSRGKLVTVYFPLPAAVPARTGAGPAGEEAPDRVSGCRVLLVDDDEALLAVGSALLAAMGVRTVTASNGREALEAVLERGNDFDLVIMDMTMPEMSGLEAYRKLRLIDTQLPVIICSGYDDSLAGEEIADDDRASFLEKPYKPDTLRKALAGMLRERT